jgi:hypothetical protein
MKKTKNSFKRDGENIRVPGYSLLDTYEEFVKRGGKAVSPKCSEAELKNGSIIISNSRVLDMPSDGEARWTLGAYLSDSGGLSRKNKMIFGLYIPKLNVRTVHYNIYIKLCALYVL